MSNIIAAGLYQFQVNVWKDGREYLRPKSKQTSTHIDRQAAHNRTPTFCGALLNWFLYTILVSIYHIIVRPFNKIPCVRFPLYTLLWCNTIWCDIMIERCHTGLFVLGKGGGWRWQDIKMLYFLTYLRSVLIFIKQYSDYMCFSSIFSLQLWIVPYLCEIDVRTPTSFWSS